MHTWIFLLCVIKFVPKITKKTYQKAEFLHIWKIQVYLGVIFSGLKEVLWPIFPDICFAMSSGGVVFVLTKQGYKKS